MDDVNAVRPRQYARLMLLRVAKGAVIALLFVPVLWAFGVAIIFAPFALTGIPGAVGDRTLERRARQVEIGQREGAVQAVMGSPNATYDASDFGTRFPMDGLVWDGHRVHGRVAVYRGPGTRVVFVYYDARGLVEHVALSLDLRD